MMIIVDSKFNTFCSLKPGDMLIYTGEFFWRNKLPEKYHRCFTVLDIGVLTFLGDHLWDVLPIPRNNPIIKLIWCDTLSDIVPKIGVMKASWFDEKQNIEVVRHTSLEV